MIPKLNWQITKLSDKNGVTNMSYKQKFCKNFYIFDWIYVLKL